MTNFANNIQSTYNAHSANSIPGQEQGVFSNTATSAGTPHYQYDALILEARLRQSLVTVRSLGKRGLRVAALETFADTPTFWSRWCEKAFICPTHGNTETYLWGLEQALQQTGARVLITSEDGNAELIKLHRSRIERYARVALAKDAALDIALNKERTLEVAATLGMQQPRAVTISSSSDIASAIREVGLPAVIKPTQSWVSQDQQHISVKGKLVTTPAEAIRVAEKFISVGATTLFQQFLAGRREAVSFLYANKHFYARFAQWARRTAPPLGGTSVLRQSIAIPHDIGTQAARLIEEIDLEGYSEVEFRRDSMGKPYLMEINPRLSASVDLAVKAGVDFPYLLYQWANGEQIDTVEGYKTGLWMRYLRGDFATTVSALQQYGRPDIPHPIQTSLSFLQSFFVPMHYDYLDWSDPMPVVATGIDFARYVSHTLKHGSFK